MGDEAALLKAIAADADEDTPRLVYADWLDENRPDRRPSPASGPSARAEFIRTQCRLAAGGFEDPEYPDLRVREHDLADWLNTHAGDPDPKLDGVFYSEVFDTGEWADYRRGFLDVVTFDDYGETAEETVETAEEALRDALDRTPARTLRLQDVTADEIALLVRRPVFARLRALQLDYLDGGAEDEAVSAVAASPRSAGLRRLFIDLEVGSDGCKALAESRHLGNLESLAIDYPIPARAVKQFASSRWFRNLRRLHLWAGGGDVLRVLSDLPPMPRLVSLTLREVGRAGPATLRRFAASEAFPRLAHLSLYGGRLKPEHVSALARGEWPLRCLDLSQNEVRRAGCEAIAAAPFAPTLRALELSECGVSAGGVQALAGADSLRGLGWLDLAANPIGPGGLMALAESPHLRGLRALDLGRTNTTRAPVSARDTLNFLSALDVPGLRRLSLDGLPVAVRGARVLASSPAFARLTQLRLEECGLGPRGAAAVVGSKTLTDLVSLSLAGNKVGASVRKLAEPRVFPRLAYCRLGTGIPKTAVARLLRRPGVRF